MNKDKVVSKDSAQIREDIDIGILSNSNVRSSAAVFSQEVGGIVRSADLSDIYDVRNNALRFSSSARVKNKTLGEANFTPQNSRSIQIPSYGTAIQQVTIPNPSVFPGYEKIPNAFVDRKTASVPVCDRASNYRNPFSDNVTPFNLPRDVVQMDVKFGNPWGPGGVFNKNIREGGRRLQGKADSDPQEYTQKRVSFNDKPKIYTFSTRSSLKPPPIY